MFCSICYVKFSLMSYSNEQYVIVHFKCVAQNYTLADDISKQKTITEEVFDGKQNNSVNFVLYPAVALPAVL